MSGNRPRLRVVGAFKSLPHGPLKRGYWRARMSKFLAHLDEQSDEAGHFLHQSDYLVSKATIEVMTSALRDLVRQYQTMAHRDRLTHAKADLLHWGTFIGFGRIPWRIEDELTIENT